METTQSEVIAKKDIKIYEPTEIKDPWELMTQFYESERYKKALAEFYKDKQLDFSVTEKEKEKTFLENHKSRVVLVDFATQDTDFRYDPSQYPEDCKNALKGYVNVEKDRIKKIREGTTDEEIVALDQYRNQYHNRVASVLVKRGIAPTFNIGETIARLVLIDKGLDTPDGAKESIQDKLKRKLGII